MDKPEILIVDDEEGIRSQLKWALNDDYAIIEAAGVEDARKLAKEYLPMIILQDIALTTREDAAEGLDLIEFYLNMNPFAKVIMITGHGQKENALTAVDKGAYDFFEKPADIDQLKIVIHRGLKMGFLEKENSQLSSELSRTKMYDELIGDSSIMKEVYKTIETVAGTKYTVLITGESGTGKELVSRAIHRTSIRRSEPFVTINCGAIPENLLESELFGHEKGAFTDAHAQKIGKFEFANKGTLFLDEIGELSLSLQVKLLRVLENHIIERVGGREEIRLDVRVLAATNRELLKEVKKGAFREDLYYRLSVITIELPPLNQRADDILLLAKTFLRRYGQENGRTNLSFSESSARAITTYQWPGNVRELENKIKRAVIMAQDKKIKPADLSLSAIPGDIGKVATLQEVRENIEKEYVLQALIRNNWNISRVSRELGTSRTTLYDLIDKYDLKK